MFGKKKEEERVEETVTENEEVKAKDETSGVETEEEVKDEAVTETEPPTEENKEGAEAVEETAEETVEEVQEVGNAARIEDLVTKEELTERLAAFEAKFEAILKENADLKELIAGLKEKYEEKDFGGMTRQGPVETSKVANDTFESYAKQFM